MDRFAKNPLAFFLTVVILITLYKAWGLVGLAVPAVGGLLLSVYVRIKHGYWL